LQAQNVWRKRAFQVMQANHTKYGQTTSAGADTKLLGALDIFRQRVDHSVENTVPTNKKFSEKIKVMVAKAAETGLLEVIRYDIPQILYSAMVVVRHRILVHQVQLYLRIHCNVAMCA
jgi:hypothetical protein